MTSILTSAEIDRFLSQQRFGRLGVHADGRTYVVPISFVVTAENRLIGQTKAGMKVDMMRANPEVCIEADEIKGIADWTSVIVWGTYKELKGAEANAAMGALIDHLAPLVEETGGGRSPRDVTPREPEGGPQVDIVYEVLITEKTGRSERP